MNAPLIVRCSLYTIGIVAIGTLAFLALSRAGMRAADF